jgi:hypothetical protein
MSLQKPTYFLTPPRSYPPSRPIRLGSIIVSPTQPDEPLHLPSLPSAADISTFTEHEWHGSHNFISSSRLGVWTCFLEALLGAGIDITVKIDKATSQAWTAESMTTMSFHPSEKFLADAVSHDDVRNYITAQKFREKIYMITGVMIASSSTSFLSTLSEKGLYVHAGVDATAWAGIPISVGPEGKWQRKSATTKSSVRTEEFVFAYRVREIRVRKKGGVKAHKVYDKGALFDTQIKRVVVDEVEVELLGLGEDVDGKEFGMDVKECEDGVACCPTSLNMLTRRKKAQARRFL